MFRTLCSAAVASVATAVVLTAPASAADEPPGDGTQAAAVLGWGTPTGGDEFEGTAIDSTKWFAYDGPGNAGLGVRSPAAITEGGGVLTIAGDAWGTTGGMGSHEGHMYGRWETRMKVPAGDVRYHPVLLLWPDAEDFPTGGEIDYAETTTASTIMSFYTHYGAANQTTQDYVAIDPTQWHNYAVEWSPSGITGYIDGVVFYHDVDPSHQPPRSMHPSIQLDWFPNGWSTEPPANPTPTTPSSMQVAWQRYYPL